MTIAEKLEIELTQIAPGWEWTCQEKPSDSPVLIAPVRIKISARNRETETKTVPIEVSCLNNTHISETARFVCQILMIETHGGARSKSLLVQS